MEESDLLIKAKSSEMKKTLDTTSIFIKKYISSTFIRKYISSMSLEEKVAQRIIIDFPGYELPREAGQLSWGGFILFPKNIQSKEQLVKLINDIQEGEAIFPKFVSVDQEGGIISPLGDLVPSLPGNMALGVIGDEGIVEKGYSIMARGCKNLGFNLLFAPVVDINNNYENPVIGVRSFGDDPKFVAKLSQAAIRGIQKEGILATAKHYPGHGDTCVDSHLALPVIKHSYERLKKIELVPFQGAVNEGVSAIMTAHILFSDIDPEYPATFSRKILMDLLREKLGFQGVIVTDSLKMEGIRSKWCLETAAVMSIKAGADIILSCGELEEHKAVFNAILKAYKNAELDELEMDKSLVRILSLKKHISACSGKNKDGKFKKGRVKKVDSNENILNNITENNITEEEINFVNELHAKSIRIIENKSCSVPVSLNALTSLNEGYVGILFTGEPNVAHQFSKELDKFTRVAWIRALDAGGVETSCREASEREGFKQLSHLFIVTNERTLLSPQIESLVISLVSLPIPVIGISFNNPFHFMRFSQIPLIFLAYNNSQASISGVAHLINYSGLAAKKQ